MKKLIKILFLLVANSSIFYTIGMEVKPTKKSLYEFFKIEQFKNLDEELKDLAVQQYCPQWWYKLRTFKNSRSVASTAFHPESDKVLISTCDKDRKLITNLFDLHGNLLKTYHSTTSVIINKNNSIIINPKENKILITGFNAQETTIVANLFDLDGNLLRAFSNDHPNCLKLLTAFDFQDQYIATASISNNLQSSIVKTWDLNGNPIGNLEIKGLILALAFNPKGEIVVVVRSSEGNINTLWYDINLECKKILTNEHSITYCCTVSLNRQANEVLLKFDPNFLIELDSTGQITDFDLIVQKLAESDKFETIKWNLNTNETEQIGIPKFDLLKVCPNNKLILTCSNCYHCDCVRLFNFDGKYLLDFPCNEFINCLVFNSQSNMIMLVGDNETNLWVLYNPTLEQLLLRKLIHLYLQTEKPTQEFICPEILFKEIVNKFKNQNYELDEEELLRIWYSISEDVRNSFWDSIINFIKKFGKNSSVKIQTKNTNRCFIQ